MTGTSWTIEEKPDRKEGALHMSQAVKGRTVFRLVFP